MRHINQFSHAQITTYSNSKNRSKLDFIWIIHKTCINVPFAAITSARDLTCVLQLGQGYIRVS